MINQELKKAIIDFSTLHNGKGASLSKDLLYAKHLGTISSHWPELRPEDFSEFWGTLKSTKTPFEIFYALLLEMPDNAIPKLVWQAERLVDNFFNHTQAEVISFPSTMTFFILHTTNHQLLCDLWTIFYEYAYVCSDEKLKGIAELLLTTTSTRHLSTEEGTVFLRTTLDEQCAQVQSNAVRFDQNRQDRMYDLISKMIIISTIYDNNHHLSDIYFNFMSSHFAPGQPQSQKKNNQKKNNMLLALLKITNDAPRPIMEKMGSAGHSVATLEHFISSNVDMFQVKDKLIETTNDIGSIIVSPDESEPRALASEFPIPNGRGSVVPGETMTEANDIIKVIEPSSTLVTEDLDAASALLGQTMNEIEIETSNQEFLSIIKNTEGNKTQDEISLMVEEVLDELISQMRLCDNPRAPENICIKVEMLIPYLKDEGYKGMRWCHLLTLLEDFVKIYDEDSIELAHSIIPTLLVTLMPEHPAALGSNRARQNYCQRLAYLLMDNRISSDGSDKILHNVQTIFSTLTPQSRVVLSYLITSKYDSYLVGGDPETYCYRFLRFIKLFAALSQDLALNEKNLFWDRIQHFILKYNAMKFYLLAIQELVPFINQINSVDITQQIKCFMHTLEMGLSNFPYKDHYTRDTTSDYGDKLAMIIEAIPAIAASVINKEQQLLIYKQYGTFFSNKPFNIKLELSRVILGTHPNMEQAKNTLYHALVTLELDAL